MPLLCFGFFAVFPPPVFFGSVFPLPFPLAFAFALAFALALEVAFKAWALLPVVAVPSASGFSAASASVFSSCSSASAVSTPSGSVAAFLVLLPFGFEEGLFFGEGMAVEQLQSWGEKVKQ